MNRAQLLALDDHQVIHVSEDTPLLKAGDYPARVLKALVTAKDRSVERKRIRTAAKIKRHEANRRARAARRVNR